MPVRQQLNSVTIYGRGGGKRTFNQAEDGSIRKAAWDPNGALYGHETLIPAGFARLYTPLAAVCWGGSLGFKEVSDLILDAATSTCLICTRFVFITSAKRTFFENLLGQILPRFVKEILMRPTFVLLLGAACLLRITMANCG